MSKIQLHQILATEGTLVDKFEKTAVDTQRNFHDVNQFNGLKRRYEKIIEDTQDFPHENKRVTTTVDEKLDNIKEDIINALDVSFQKESTNQLAKADVKIGDTVIIANAPATYLLSLEKRLKVLKALANSIPTLDNDIEWIETEGKSDIMQQNEEIVTYKTAKIKDFKVVVPADQYQKAAHVEPVTKDVYVGQWLTRKLSGAYSSKNKADILKRIEDLILAVKVARSKANQQEVELTKVGKKIVNYIFS